MPHSSGGGSHSSGSHGGSYHSSSGGGSHGGGLHVASYSSSPHTRKKYFYGASKYVYYRKNRPVYFYSDSDPTQRKGNPLRFLMLLVYVPMLIAIIGMMGRTVHVPEKIKGNYSKEIVMTDNAGVLNDTDSLYDTLEKFRKETGIVPAVVTVNNEDWQSDYTSLEDYAFDIYVNLFDDENHWLIVYSEPFFVDEGTFNDWSWEGMQGDNTDKILKTSLLSDFNNQMQTNLTARSRLTVSEAIDKTFEDTMDDFMKIQISFSHLFSALFVFLFICFHAYFMLDINPKEKYYRKATKISQDAKEDTCEYCDNLYVVGSCTTCPHCGAPISPHNSENGQTNTASDFD